MTGHFSVLDIRVGERVELLRRKGNNQDDLDATPKDSLLFRGPSRSPGKSGTRPTCVGGFGLNYVGPDCLSRLMFLSSGQFTLKVYVLVITKSYSLCEFDFYR